MLRCLTDLRCYRLDVFLPALAVIAPQLRTLTLQRCRLHCWVAGQDTYAFALGWHELVELDLGGASLDGNIAAVHMPRLQKLHLGGFWIKNDDEDGTQSHCNIQAFGP